MNKPASIPGGLSRFRIDLAYDGTDYAGWAIQPGLRTIEGEVLKALRVVFGDLPEGLRVGGRTDAGVHALGQVFHLDLDETQTKRVSHRLVGKLNAVLDDDIRVSSFEPAPEGFHARYSATKRSYRYRILDSNEQDPLSARYHLWHYSRLDEKLMQEASKQLLGLHDFASFCRRRAGATTIREMKKIEVSRQGNLVQIDLEADAFCHTQVRSIVGALMKVGSGKMTETRLGEILEAKRRLNEFKVVGPEGLTLMQIHYPEESLLAAQAEKTRNLRILD